MQGASVAVQIATGITSERRADVPYGYWVTLLLLSLTPLCSQGYGSDLDTYGVLQAGYSTWHMHIPHMSRNPGYWLYEAVAYNLSAAGGYVLCNLASLVVALAATWRFYRLALRRNTAFPALLTACLVVTPVFAIAATSTMDYVWSLLCIVLAAEMLLDDRLLAASVWGGLAISLRGANGVVVAGGVAAAIGYELWKGRRVTPKSIKLAISGVGAALLGSLTYIESFRVAGNSMNFTKALVADPSAWTLKLRMGKFLYKSCYAFGPFAMIVFVAAAAVFFMQDQLGEANPVAEEGHTRSTWLCSGFVLANLALYFKFPIEVSYLIPAVFFFLLLVGNTIFQRSRGLLIAFFLGILSLNFVLPSLAQPNVPALATSAHLHFKLIPGTMLQDLKIRRSVMRCRPLDLACLNVLWDASPHQ